MKKVKLNPVFEGVTPEQMRMRMKSAQKKCGSIKNKEDRQKCISQFLKNDKTIEKHKNGSCGGTPRRDGSGGGKGNAGPGSGGGGRERNAMNLVDIILTGDYTSYKTLNEVDVVLDKIKNQHILDQNLDYLTNYIVDELTKDSQKEQEQNQEESSITESIQNVIELLVTEEEYRKFFKRMMKKYNINSPSELSTEKKKEFFNTIDKEWKAKKESD